MKNYKFKINGNQYEVEVLDIDDNVARIEVNGTLYEVEMQREIPKVKVAAPPPQSRALKEVKPPEDKSAGKVLEVRPPLPGVIMQVLVRTGDAARAVKSVGTLEPLKMENAIKAEKGGKVDAVNISPGQSVLQDEVLIVINQ